MKGDRELCTAAVTQDGKALKWASEEMKGDRELCTAAVIQDGQARLPTSPPRSYLTPSLVAGAGCVREREGAIQRSVEQKSIEQSQSILHWHECMDQS